MNMYRFSALVFQHCSKLASYTYTWQAHYDEWRKTKAETPTCGAALMNSDLDQVVLVKGFTPGWMFPRGKINDREAKAKFYPQAAAREVLEETGFDIGPILDPELYIERVALLSTRRANGFQIQTGNSKRIEAILWFRLSDLPTSRSDEDCARRIALKSKDFFLVIPFVSQLRRWAALVRQGGLSRVAALR
uniref:Nudix hydrolase domain-containing protein n=1 Tax=Macrostomum lignano TaxID=282301 RepID=A0A1I8G8U5_9PLAT